MHCLAQEFANPKQHGVARNRLHRQNFEKAYCYTVCQQWGWLEPIYWAGASLVDLIEEVIGSGRRHDTLCIISNANKVVSMKWTEYLKTTREDVWKAVYHLAEHIQNNTVSKHLILFGADVSLFEGAPFPDDYRRIQQDILKMLSYMGLNAGTGMEKHYGDFGRFKSKLDRNWHIQGAYRDEAEAYLQAILAATSSSTTSPSLGVVDIGPSKSEAYSSLVVSEASLMTPEASSSSSLIKMGSLADGGRHFSRVRQTLILNTEKERWIEYGRQRSYMWPRCSKQTSLKVVLCPVDAEEGTVLVCTSGDKQTEAQTHLTCQMLYSLGWRPHIINGVAKEAFPPKSWKIGCRATFAWYVSLMPQILACAEDLGTNECLMVVEDSCWPSDCLTPQRVYEELQKRKKALWLAALLQPKVYSHKVGDTDVSARAVAGSKCFCGDKAFWRNVDTLFNTSDKNSSTDSIFQMMVGLGELDLVYPFLGATMPHISQRIRQVSSHCLALRDIDGNLLPLPKEWETDLQSILSGADAKRKESC